MKGQRGKAAGMEVRYLEGLPDLRAIELSLYRAWEKYSPKPCTSGEAQ